MKWFCKRLDRLNIPHVLLICFSRTQQESIFRQREKWHCIILSADSHADTLSMLWFQGFCYYEKDFQIWSYCPLETNTRVAGLLLNFPWLSLIFSVVMSKDKCNIEGITGLTPEASIQSFHYFLESVTTDTSPIYCQSFKSFSGVGSWRS